MTREITQRELRNDSGAVLRAVESGETLVVTRNGTPLAELRPFRRRRFVGRAELMSAAQRLGPIDAGSFRSDVDEVLDQNLERDL